MKIIKKYFYTIITKLGITLYTKKQKRIIYKLNNKVTNKLDSVIFFTTHKCASNFTNEILKKVEENSDFTLYDYGALIGSLSDRLKISLDFENYLNNNYDHLFYPYGEIYGPQRKPLNFVGVENYKKIFFFRDPRDILVSAYHSFGFTHPIPNSKILSEEFIRNRNKIQQQSIDDYVIEQAFKWIVPMFENYKKIYDETQNKIYLKYDYYTSDTKSFLKEIFNYFDIIDENCINQLHKISNPIQETTNENSHKRSGKSGQWKVSLSKETQIKLNKILLPILRDWDFN